MLIKGLQLFLGSIAQRSIRLDENLPSGYLAAVAFDHAVCLARSLKYLGRPQMSPGRFFNGRAVTIRCKSHVKIEKGVRLGEHVHIDGFGREGISIGNGTSIGAYSRLICSGTISSMGAYIRIGQRVGLAEFSRIGGSGGVEIGDDTIIAQYFSAHPENHIYDDPSRPIRAQGTSKAPIAIGRNCWIGAKVTVTAGVTIGEGAVIGSGAVVTSDIPPYCVAAGVPARVLKRYAE